MTFKHVLLTSCAAAMIAACETTIPGDDSQPPTVKISVPRDGNEIIASTEADEVLSVDLTCGAQTDLGVNVYVMRRDFPARLMLTVGDSGGVSLARAVVTGGSISNVEPADATVRSDTFSGQPATVVEKSYDRADPRTGQVILFDVEPTTGTIRGPNTVAVHGVGFDFSGNGRSSSRTPMGVQEALCGNI
ncbi:hypothetical protein [Hyphococcus luteus]|uniref:Uncharacterized protein n=1 Tax=Hyphococcus luteus TaxID=2058213 RepID=A0A2S7K826_9PROT|nr:hypothetical protein [Marinicaulis flavus]PQA88650.1 hypothetical protein CW354_10245 [Marinicaulis flavus]